MKSSLYFVAKEYVLTCTELNDSFEEDEISYPSTFTWEGGKFQTRPNQSATAYTRRKRKIQPINSMRPTQKEEYGVGALVVANQIFTIEKYLRGPARRPFLSPRKLYVLVILDIFQPDFGNVSENVMVKLWKDYGIADALLITPCNAEVIYN